MSQDKEIVTFLKKINMLKVIDKIVMAWDQISPQTIRRLWWKLIPIEDDDGAGQEDLLSNTELVDNFQTLGYKLQEENIQEWLDSVLGYEHLNDDHIVEHVQQLHSTHIDDSESEGEENITCITCPVSNREAMKMFEKCLTWLQHQPEAFPYNTSVLSS